MSNCTITIKIPLNDNNSRNQSINNTAESMIKKINQIKQTVYSLRDSCMENEQIRDQYIIHFQQCSEDREILSKIYKNLKFKYEHQNDEVKHEESQTKTIPTLEVMKRDATIHKMSEKTQLKSIQARYQISVSTSIYNIQFSPDGNLIAFTDYSNLYLVQSEDGELLIQTDISPNECRLPENSVNSNDFLTPGHCLQFSPNGAFLAVSNGANVLLYSVQQGTRSPLTLVHTFNRFPSDVTALAFNKDSTWMVTGSDGKIIGWDTSSYESPFHFDHEIPPGTSIVSISTPLDASMYVVAFSNGTIGIYNETFDPPMVSFNAITNGSSLLDAQVSPVFPDTIVTCSSDFSAKVWAMRGVASCKFTLSGHTDAVTSATFCPVEDAPILFTSSGPNDKKIRAWQHKTGELLYSMEIHTDGISKIVSHPAKTSFVSCGRDGLICVWDYELA